MKHEVLSFFTKLAAVAAAAGDGNSEALANRVKAEVTNIPDDLFSKTLDALRDDETAAMRARLAAEDAADRAGPQPVEVLETHEDVSGGTTAGAEGGSGDGTAASSVSSDPAGGVTAESTPQPTAEEMAAKFAPNTENTAPAN